MRLYLWVGRVVVLYGRWVVVVWQLAIFVTSNGNGTILHTHTHTNNRCSHIDCTLVLLLWPLVTRVHTNNSRTAYYRYHGQITAVHLVRHVSHGCNVALLYYFYFIVPLIWAPPAGTSATHTEVSVMRCAVKAKRLGWWALTACCMPHWA